LNLTTGEVRTIYSRSEPRALSAEWHDVDKLGKNRYIIADMASDEVVIINSTTGITVWEWNVQAAFSLQSGGPYPDDWVHLNDVEMTEKGIMLSLRNQDQVIFVDRQDGINRSLTLGAEDRYDVLFEQHNPDYLSNSTGQYSILVADSENDRVVEYRRSTDGEYQESWEYSQGLQWPRDADRLPNNHTLITDSYGDRVFEINEKGEVVWELTVYQPYEAERVGTGDESVGGRGARIIGLNNTTSIDDVAKRNTLTYQLKQSVKQAFPPKIRHGIIYLLPSSLSFYEASGLGFGLLSLTVWFCLELLWSPYQVEIKLMKS
jgi:hypothetical protein